MVSPLIMDWNETDRHKGHDDLLLPTDNSYLMWKKLSKAKGQLHLYPNSGHGFLWQYAEDFARLVNGFLDEREETLSRL